MFDLFRQKAVQRDETEEQRKQAVRQAIMQLASDGNKIDGVLLIYTTQDKKIHVMEGGIQDDFEAQVMLQRAEYLINRDGLVR